MPRFVVWVAACAAWLGASLAGASSATHEVQTPARAAACWTMVDARLLIVRDVWSGRFSLPQATAHQNETLANAAERATTALTGVEVRAGPEMLWATPALAVFVCAAANGQVSARGDDVPLSTEARRATVEARLATAVQLERTLFRDAAEKAGVDAHLAALVDPRYPHAAAHHVRTVLAQLLRAQLRCAHWLQRHNPQAFVPLLGLPSIFGHVALWTMALGALTWAWTRWREGAELVLFALVAALVGAVLKDLCALPRPYHLDASLLPRAGSGYSFPSGTTLMLTAVIGLVLRRTRRRAWAWLAALACFSCGLVCVGTGRNFGHDVIGAWVLGAALVLGYEAVLRRANLAYLPLRAWLVVGLVVGAFALSLDPLPWPTEVLGLHIGLCLGLPICRFADRPLSIRARTALALSMLTALFVIAICGQHAQHTVTHMGTALVVRVLAAIGMGLVLPVLHWTAHVLGRRLEQAA